MSDGNSHDPIESRRLKERRKRNIALALALGGLAILIFLMSLVQWHGQH